jgi:Flp pilus assembly protein TadD
MSLLQDALRKAQTGSKGGPPPGIPSPPPYGPGSPARRKRRVTAVAALGVVFLMVAGIVYFAARSHYEGVPQGQIPSAVPPVAEPAPPPSSTLGSVASSDRRVPGGEGEAADTSTSKPRKGPAASGLASARKPAAGKAAADSRDSSPPKGSFRRTPVSHGSHSDGSPPSVLSQGPVSRNAGAEWLADYNRAVQAQRKGDWESSARLFQEVVSSNPALIEGWNGLGVSLMGLGRTAEAEEAIRKALSLDPDYAVTLVNAGLLRMRMGGVKEAAIMFERAAAIDPRKPEARVNLAISLARLGRLAEAEATLLATRRMFPSDPDVLYHLGTVQERRGDRAGAARSYSDFLAASAGRDTDRERLVADHLRDWGR